jgi:predicted transcriptional regulator
MSSTHTSKIEIQNYCVADLMSKDVLSVYEGWTIQRLAEFFLNHDISGAPVIASDHELVGVVSISDIFRFENSDDDTKSEALRRCYRDSTGIDIASREDLVNWSKNSQTSCTVHQIMAKQVISVGVDSNLSDVSATMIENDIHRVFVTADEKIVGIVSALDILRKLPKSEDKTVRSAH